MLQPGQAGQQCEQVKALTQISYLYNQHQPRNTSRRGIGDIEIIILSCRDPKRFSARSAGSKSGSLDSPCPSNSECHSISSSTAVMSTVVLAALLEAAAILTNKLKTQTSKRVSQLVSLSRDSKGSQSSQRTLIDNDHKSWHTEVWQWQYMEISSTKPKLGWWKKSLSSSSWPQPSSRKEKHGHLNMTMTLTAAASQCSAKPRNPLLGSPTSWLALRWDSRRASTATVLKRKSKANTEKGNPGKSSLSIYGILLKMTKGTNVKSVWNQNERKQLILTDDHNTFSTTNWVDLTLNRWGQKRTHAKIHPAIAVVTYLPTSTFGVIARSFSQM